MDKDFFELFFSVLALAANLLVVGLIVLWVLARRSDTASLLLQQVGEVSLWLAGLIAVTSMAGSLYMSDVAPKFTPCVLCWYQRIAMYPLAVLLVLAAVRRDQRIRFYGIVLAVIGAAISTYHYVVERLDIEAGSCSASVPCNVPWFEEFGFVTLAYMALSGFLAIIALLLVRPTMELEA